jgi:hypothetical protein
MCLAVRHPCLRPLEERALERIPASDPGEVLQDGVDDVVPVITETIFIADPYAGQERVVRRRRSSRAQLARKARGSVWGWGPASRAYSRRAPPRATRAPTVVATRCCPGSDLGGEGVVEIQRIEELVTSSGRPRSLPPISCSVF